MRDRRVGSVTCEEIKRGFEGAEESSPQVRHIRVGLPVLEEVAHRNVLPSLREQMWPALPFVGASQRASTGGKPPKSNSPSLCS
jgi:hypothetical protein